MGKAEIFVEEVNSYALGRNFIDKRTKINQ